MKEKELKAIIEREGLTKGTPIEIEFHPYDLDRGRLIDGRIERTVGLFYQYFKGAIHYVHSTNEIPPKDELWDAAAELDIKGATKERTYSEWLRDAQDYLNLIKKLHKDLFGFGGAYGLEQLVSVKKLVPHK